MAGQDGYPQLKLIALEPVVRHTGKVQITGQSAFFALGFDVFHGRTLGTEVIFIVILFGLGFDGQPTDGAVITLLLSMLGLGGARTWEKLKGVARL